MQQVIEETNEFVIGWVPFFRHAACKKHLIEMDQWLRRFRGAIPIAGQPRVLVPGDPEREIEIIRRSDGIPLLLPVIDDLNTLAKRFGLHLPR